MNIPSTVSHSCNNCYRVCFLTERNFTVKENCQFGLTVELGNCRFEFFTVNENTTPRFPEELCYKTDHNIKLEPLNLNCNSWSLDKQDGRTPLDHCHSIFY